MSVLFKYLITSDVFVSVVLPKLKSVNIGTVVSSCSVSSVMSKSDGNGSNVSEVVSVSVADSESGKFILISSGCFVARINALRISGGMFSANVGSSESDFVSDCCLSDDSDFVFLLMGL